MKSIVLIGQVACGKGTQSKLLQERLGMYPIGMGDILRDHKRRGTDIGKMATELDKEGKLMPNNIIIGLMREEILNNKDSVNGFIFDGAVRTVEQAIALDEMMRGIGVEYEVVYISLPTSKCVSRALHRGKTSGRIEDSSEEIILKRIEVFMENTKPALDWYKERDMLNEVIGIEHIESIHQEIKSILTFKEKPKNQWFKNKLNKLKSYIRKNLGMSLTVLFVLFGSTIRNLYGWEWGVMIVTYAVSVLLTWVFYLIDGQNKKLFWMFTLLIPSIIFIVTTNPLYTTYYLCFMSLIHLANNVDNLLNKNKNEESKNK